MSLHLKLRWRMRAAVFGGASLNPGDEAGCMCWRGAHRGARNVPCHTTPTREHAPGCCTTRRMQCQLYIAQLTASCWTKSCLPGLCHAHKQTLSIMTARWSSTRTSHGALRWHDLVGMQRVLAGRAVVVPGVEQEVDQERQSQAADRQCDGDDQPKLHRLIDQGQVIRALAVAQDVRRVLRRQARPRYYGASARCCCTVLQHKSRRDRRETVNLTGRSVQSKADKR